MFGKPEPNGDYAYLFTRHFDDNGQLSHAIYPDIPSNAKTQKHALIPGDVLFAAKGAKNFAAVYHNNNPPAIASTSFLILRLYNTNNILPEYLAWSINQPNTMAYLRSQAKGTSIASISKKTLGELEVSIPSIEMQQTILEIMRLRKREKSIRERIENLRDQHIQQLLIQAIA
ncbi:MAG: restriction endonuclease subunit S [Cryomorphaceae bacterium]|nr:restriction endonuclease subunit S [Cryomorphaceae bacterium]